MEGLARATGVAVAGMSRDADPGRDPGRTAAADRRRDPGRRTVADRYRGRGRRAPGGPRVDHPRRAGDGRVVRHPAPDPGLRTGGRVARTGDRPDRIPSARAGVAAGPPSAAVHRVGTDGRPVADRVSRAGAGGHPAGRPATAGHPSDDRGRGVHRVLRVRRVRDAAGHPVRRAPVDPVRRVGALPCPCRPDDAGRRGADQPRVGSAIRRHR